MSTSDHILRVKAKDNTAGAFSSISSRAKSAGSRITSLMGGALAAAGAYMGLRQIGAAINELGTLSDVAQATSTSVGEITSASTALQTLGIRGASVEGMAKAFMFMEKNTGRSGMAGFYETIEEIGKLPSAAARSQAAIAAFGRSGMMFMPLINAADQGTEALKGVVDVMPSIPQSAAEAGDDASDAIKILGDNVKSVWMQAIGSIVGWFGKNFEGGIRGAAASAGNYLVYYAKVSVQACLKYYRQFTDFFERVGTWIGTAIGTYTGGGSFSESLAAANKAWADETAAQEVLMEEFEARQEKQRESWAMDFVDKQAKIKKIGTNYRKSTETSNSRKARTGEIDTGMDFGSSSLKKAVQNSLIMANTASALRLAMNGPQFNEEKKHTSQYDKMIRQLQDINSNTKPTSDDDEWAGA